MVLPWLQGAVLDVLRGDAAFMASVEDRVDVEAPADVSRPFVVVRLLDPGSVDPGGVGWVPLVQVSAWSPRLVGRDVRGVLWTVAAHVVRISAAMDEPVLWQNVGFGLDLVVGPSEHPVDLSRGADTPLFGMYVHLDMPLQLLPA